MIRRTRDPDGPEQIFSELDSALLEVLGDAPDEHAAVRARRLRVMGSAALVLASACMAAIALPLIAQLPFGVGLLFGAAVLLLLCGGWSIDRATVLEIKAHRIAATNPIANILLDANLGLTQSSIRRRRHFGRGMLLLSGFCVCVAWAPLPGKQAVDVAMWVGFAVTLVAVGSWQLNRAFKDARDARAMSSAAQHRDAAKTGTHLSLTSSRRDPECSDGRPTKH